MFNLPQNNFSSDSGYLKIRFRIPDPSLTTPMRAQTMVLFICFLAIPIRLFHDFSNWNFEKIIKYEIWKNEENHCSTRLKPIFRVHHPLTSLILETYCPQTMILFILFTSFSLSSNAQNMKLNLVSMWGDSIKNKTEIKVMKWWQIITHYIST